MRCLTRGMLRGAIDNSRRPRPPRAWPALPKCLSLDEVDALLKGVSSDDEGAAASVAALAEQLGFAPVNLGKLEEGGALVQAREDKSWGPLIFQDLFKNERERPTTAAAGS